MTLTYDPQEFAGQLSSYAAEDAEYRWYVQRVPGLRQKISMVANGARHLAIGECVRWSRLQAANLLSS